MRKRNILALVLCFLFIFLLIFRSCFVELDVDLGWHLRIGKDLIVNHVFPYFDIYSFSHFNYAWIDHEWLLEAISYLIYAKTNFIVLALFFTLIITTVFYLQFKIITKLRLNYLIAILLSIIAVIAILNFAAVRMQIFTWFGAALLFYILFKHSYENNKKLLFFIPLMILFWVNCHGGFILGIAMLIIYTLFTQKDKKVLFLIILLSVLTTLINPYGIEIYKEIWFVTTDSYLQSNILEWASLWSYPLNLFEIIYILLFMVFSLIKFNFKKIHTPVFVILIFLLIFTFLHKRNAPIFILLSLPYLTLLIEAAFNKSCISKYLNASYIIIGGLVLINLVILTSISEKINYLEIDPYNNQENYYYQTVNYLKNNPQLNNIFTDFSWGGYLLWQMPENNKVFFDGRMVSWHKNNNLFLKDFIDLNSGNNNWQDIVKKYDVKNIVVEKQSYVARIQPKDCLNQLFYKNKIEMLKNKKNNLYLQIIKNSGWQMIYENDQCYIFSLVNKN